MISVIMPVYNTEQYLRGALASVLGQTYTDLELIAVNDGSTDSSPEILKEAAASDKRVRIIDQPNGGVSRARNAALDAARGEWIYFMDSDDAIDPDMLKKLMELSEGADVVISGVNEHDLKKDKEVITAYGLPDVTLRSREEIGDYLENIFRYSKRGVFWNFLWNRLTRADLIRDAHLRFEEDVRLGEDFLFNTEVLKRASFVRVTGAAYYHYFVRGFQSLTGRFDPNELERRKRMYRAMTDLYKAFDRYETCRASLEWNEGKLTFACLNKINYPSCSLDERGKVRYIKDFLADERRAWLLSYMTGKKGRKNALRRAAIRLGNARMLYLLIKK